MEFTTGYKERMIPVSVIIVTKNEAHNLPRCLKALQGFDDIIIVDSNSTDGTVDIARSHGVTVHDFVWNGRYPKKRQWCLDTLPIKNDFVFFVDADEVVPPELVQEIAALDFTKAGYFVKGANVVGGRVCKYGLKNNKLALLNRHKMQFPVVNDLDIPGMGEIEGHYQPILKAGYEKEEIGQLRTPLHHYCFEDKTRWQGRHEGYAVWEREMTRRNAYPRDPSVLREGLKRIFRRLPFRAQIIFLYGYILKGGFLDGVAGYISILCKAQYYYKK
jgi:glycosyltransferase involved in cell wall biosynthesis